MSNMKVVSLIDTEIVKARRVALDDLHRVQQQLLETVAIVATEVAALGERVAALEAHQALEV
jgi:hypothetical protein